MRSSIAETGRRAVVETGKLFKEGTVAIVTMARETARGDQGAISAISGLQTSTPRTWKQIVELHSLGDSKISKHEQTTRVASQTYVPIPAGLPGNGVFDRLDRFLEGKTNGEILSEIARGARRITIGDPLPPQTWRPEYKERVAHSQGERVGNDRFAKALRKDEQTAAGTRLEKTIPYEDVPPTFFDYLTRPLLWKRNKQAAS